MPADLTAIRAMITRIERAAERGVAASFDDVESACEAATELSDEVERLRAQAECNTIARGNLTDENKRLRGRLTDVTRENARLRSALYQAKVAARFPNASDAWDQVRAAVSVLDDVSDGS